MEVNFRCLGKSGAFSAKDTFNGVQNKPNSTNETTAYILDTAGLHWIDLNLNGSSLICINGTGEVCADQYNKYNTTIRTNTDIGWAE